jgi:hypothetical protein
LDLSILPEYWPFAGAKANNLLPKDYKIPGRELSASEVSGFKPCARKWHTTYNYRAQEDAALEMGRKMHESLLKAGAKQIGPDEYEFPPMLKEDADKAADILYAELHALATYGGLSGGGKAAQMIEEARRFYGLCRVCLAPDGKCTPECEADELPDHEVRARSPYVNPTGRDRQAAKSVSFGWPPQYFSCRTSTAAERERLLHGDWYGYEDDSDPTEDYLSTLREDIPPGFED